MVDYYLRLRGDEHLDNYDAVTMGVINESLVTRLFVVTVLLG